MKRKLKQKKGISLIVLVITIVVIVILATAVIVSLASNNPIDNAREAVEKNNESEYESELSLYIGKQYAENKGNFKTDNLNVFSEESLKKVITAMKDEDAKNYIIWQGKLAKKQNDGNYYYENGEAVKIFDMQVMGEVDEEDESKGRQTLNQNMVEFLVEFEKTQTEKNIAEEDKLIYNEGYITNCLDQTVLELKDKLPAQTAIKSYNISPEASELGDSKSVGTDYGVYYNGELVARFVVFGDVDTGDLLLLNRNDAVEINVLVSSKGNGFTLGQIIAADVTEDGTLNTEDYELLKNSWSSWRNSGNQKRPAIIPSF